jgi:uncharacterized protein
MNPSFLSRCRVQAVCTAVLALSLLACGTPTPAPQLYHLRAAPPVAVKAVTTRHTVQLMAPVRVPELLDRSELLLPQGQAGLQPLASHRWAEPLRDAIPRLLQQDLTALLGDQRVWVAPLPAGTGITRQLRVEVLSLLQARYTLADLGSSGSSAAPLASTLTIEVPSAGPEPDALVSAYRLALWRLSERIASAL